MILNNLSLEISEEEARIIVGDETITAMKNVAIQISNSEWGRGGEGEYIIGGGNTDTDEVRLAQATKDDLMEEIRLVLINNVKDREIFTDNISIDEFSLCYLSRLDFRNNTIKTLTFNLKYKGEINNGNLTK